MQLNTWDDHEIFDGWGSYPPHLQNCDAFASVFRLAKRMYAAFQLHTTVKTQKSDGYFTAQARPPSLPLQGGPVRPQQLEPERSDHLFFMHQEGGSVSPAPTSMLLLIAVFDLCSEALREHHRCCYVSLLLSATGTRT